MPSRDADDTLRALRAVFRDELEDSLAPLEAARATLSRADAAAAHADAIAEVFRVVHSLKGAARAVAWPALERFCHALETRLGEAREGRASTARAADDAAVALATLGACLRHLDAHGAPDDDALARASRALHEPAASPREAPAVRPPARPVAQPAPAAPTPVVSTPSPDETTRVSVARLATLIQATEDLAAASGRLDDGAFLAAVESSLTELRDALRRASVTDDAVARAMSQSLAMVSERRLSDRAARRALSLAGDEALLRTREMRVLPVESLAPALERAVAEAAQSLGRAARFTLEGARVELDRRVLEGLREPLLHLVRNAVDHGLEGPDERARAGKGPMGTVRLVVTSAGRDVSLSVVDDGRGIDGAAVLAAARAKGMSVAHVRDPFALLFEAGFTTRASVSELSGRGVGLDVVRQRVARLHGHVALRSRLGEGTAVTLTAPVDLSVTRALLTRVGEVTAAFVTTAVLRVRRIGPDEVRAVGGARHILDDDALVPLASLAEALGFSPTASHGAAQRRPCVVVSAGERRVAFLVDALLDERDLVVRALGPRLARVPFVAGTAQRDDGEVALVLDAGDLVGYAAPSVEEAPVAERAPRRVLVVDDSLTTRQLLRTILESAGYVVTVAPDGAAAWALLSGDARFEAVVSDVEMPRMDGWALLARIRGTERTARTPVVLVTALSQVSEQQRALSMGASAYVVKGRFDQDDLLQSLDQLVHGGGGT